MTLSDFIRQQRKKYKLTQRDLADRSGVGLRFIRELERGKATLRMDKYVFRQAKKEVKFIFRQKNSIAAMFSAFL